MNATGFNSEKRIERDVLHGLGAIGDFLGITVRQAKLWHETERIPTFTMPGSRTVCARRSTLTAWLAQREAAGRAPIEPKGDHRE